MYQIGILIVYCSSLLYPILLFNFINNEQKHKNNSTIKKIFSFLLALYVCTYTTQAQENIGYQKPHKSILDLVDVQLACH